MQAGRARRAAELERLTSGVTRRAADQALKLAEAYRWRLRDALQATEAYNVRDVFHGLLDRVEVRFNRRQTACQTRCEFAGGLRWVNLAGLVASTTPGGAKSRAINGWSLPSPPRAGSSTCSRAKSSGP